MITQICDRIATNRRARSAAMNVAMMGVLVALAGGVTAADVAPLPRAFTAKAPLPRALPSEGFVWEVTEKQEIVVFTTHRPVRVRMEMTYEGKTISEVSLLKLREVFDYYDRNKDGYLGEKEVTNIFSDSGLNLLLLNGFFQITPNDRPSLERLDTNRDGRVSLEEYLSSYKISAASFVRPQVPMAENPLSAGTTEALFELMDANKDGKLTKEEVKGIEKLIFMRDADEDECLSLTELAPNVYAQGGRVVQVNPVGRPAQPVVVANPAAEIVQMFAVDKIPESHTTLVIKKYDKDNDGSLTRDEIAFDAETFARFDRDKDSKLNATEVDAWRTGPPDLEVVLSLSPNATDCAAKLVTPREVANDRRFIISQVEPGRIVIRVGRQAIEFSAFSQLTPRYQQSTLKMQFRAVFTQAAGGKDHILDSDLTGPNAVRYQYVRTIFDPADSNGDSKLTQAEFDAYFDLQEGFRDIAMAITPAVQTPTLFQLLDENRDSRLSVRELRTAWDRLRPLEPGNGDVITRAAIQPSISVRGSRSLDRYAVNQQQYAYQNPNQIALPQNGPQWFRRMDRNADGDISRTEFLGSKAEFDAMDQDHDGLISLKEAEEFDNRTREKDEKK